MKKILIILLAGLLMAGLIACGKGDNEDLSSTSSTISIFEEDENLTSSELEQIVSDFKENVSITITPVESSKESSSQAGSIPSSSVITSSTEVSSQSQTSSTGTATSSTAVSSTQSSSSSATSSAITSSKPVWIGPF